MSCVRYIDSYERRQTNVSAPKRVKICKTAKVFVKKTETKDGTLLQCLVPDASPGFKLNISWFDGSGTKLTERQIDVKEGGRSYVLTTTVTKTDTYRCVATMEELRHQVYEEIDLTGPSVVPWVIVGIALTLAAAVAVVLFLYYRMTRSPVIIRVKKGEDVMLPCKIYKDIKSERFEWKKDGQKEVFLYETTVLLGQDPQFTGRVSHDGNLMNGDASITIRETKVVDSGVYTCEFPRLHQTFTVKLVVGGKLRDRSLEFLGMKRRPSNHQESQPMNQVN